MYHFWYITVHGQPIRSHLYIYIIITINLKYKLAFIINYVDYTLDIFTKSGKSLTRQLTELNEITVRVK